MSTAIDGIAVAGSVSFGWLHAEGGFVFDEAFFTDPSARLRRERILQEYVASRFPDLPIYVLEASLVQVEGRRRPVVLIGGLQPNLLLGAALGAPLVFPGDKDPDIASAPLAGSRIPDRLEATDWAATWPFSMFLEQVLRARETFGRTHVVVPPFFWDATGRATIHGLLTTAVKLAGQEFLLQMTDDPPYARAALEALAEAYARLIRLFSKAAGMTVTGLHVGECSAGMIGPGRFRDFVLEPTCRLARETGPVRLHSCGRSDNLLEVFAAIEPLACLNVGGGTSLTALRQRFGMLRVDLLPDNRLLTEARPSEVDAWVRRTLEANAGGPLEIQYHLDAGQRAENAVRLHRALADAGIRRRREPIY